MLPISFVLNENCHFLTKPVSQLTKNRFFIIKISPVEKAYWFILSV